MTVPAADHDIHGVDNGGAACPTDEPDLDSQCSIYGQECEYGGPGPVTSCSSHFLWCGGGGRFGHTWRTQGSSRPCADTFDAGVCPSQRKDVIDGAACTGHELMCEYDRETCACTRGARGTDAPHWACVTAPAGCPAQRPHFGSACSIADWVCDYGLCTFETSGSLMVCDGTQWTYNKREPGVMCP